METPVLLAAALVVALLVFVMPKLRRLAGPGIAHLTVIDVTPVPPPRIKQDVVITDTGPIGHLGNEINLRMHFTDTDDTQLITGRHAGDTSTTSGQRHYGDDIHSVGRHLVGAA